MGEGLECFGGCVFVAQNWNLHESSMILHFFGIVVIVVAGTVASYWGRSEIGSKIKVSICSIFG